MAHVIGTSGHTAKRVHADRLLQRSSGWAWLLPTVGVGAAAVIWGVGGTGTPAVTVVAFALAAAGIVWMLITSVLAVRRASGAVAGVVEFASAAADLAVAAGIGGIAGSALAQTDVVAIHGEAAAAGMTSILVAVWWRVQSSAKTVTLLRAGAEGEREVAAILETLPDGFVVLHDLMVPTKTGRREVDHVVLGPTGVFVLETKRWGGVLTPGESVWVQEGRRGRRTYSSPVIQLQRVQRAVADRLGITMDQVTPLLVLVGGTLNGNASMPITRPAQLRDTVLQGSTAWSVAGSTVEDVAKKLMMDHELVGAR